MIDRIDDYLDGVLSPSELEAFNVEMDRSKDFRSLVEDLQRNRRLLKSLAPVAVPPGLEQRILMALRRTAPPPFVSRFRTAFSAKALALVAASAIAAVVVFQLPTPKRTPPAPAPLPSEPVAKAAAPTQPAPQPEPDSFLGFRSEQAPIQTQPIAQGGAFGAPAVPSDRPGRPLTLKMEAPKAEPSAFWLRGHQSGITEAEEQVVSSPETWAEIWSRHAASHHPIPESPAISFENNDLLAIFAGSQPTGGISVIVDNIEYTDWEGEPARIISYHLSTPPPDAMTTMVVTQPFLIMEIPKFQGKTLIQQSL